MWRGYCDLDPRRLLAVRDHLKPFFALHVVALPIVLLALVVLHILALHEVGSNNPDGVEIKKNKGADGVPLDGIKFHPYYSVHDVQGIAVFLFFFCGVTVLCPEMGGFFLEFANFEEANGLKTPEHIAPCGTSRPITLCCGQSQTSSGGLCSLRVGRDSLCASLAGSQPGAVLALPRNAQSRHAVCLCALSSSWACWA